MKGRTRAKVKGHLKNRIKEKIKGQNQIHTIALVLIVFMVILSAYVVLDFSSIIMTENIGSIESEATRLGLPQLEVDSFQKNPVTGTVEVTVSAGTGMKSAASIRFILTTAIGDNCYAESDTGISPQGTKSFSVPMGSCSDIIGVEAVALPAEEDAEKSGDGAVPMVMGGGPSITEGLVAHYMFEGNADDEMLNYHGVEYNGVTYHEDSERGWVASFDGVDDYILIGVTDWLPIGDMTISVWVNAITWGGIPGDEEGRIIEADSGQRFYMDGSGGDTRVRFRACPVDCQKVDSAQDMNITEWKHLALVRTGNIYRFYIDGSLSDEDDDDTGFPVNGYDLRIGNNFGNDRQFHGYMDDLMIFDRALSPGEVGDLYGGMVEEPTPGPLSDYIVANYMFEGDANDETGRHDGTLMNGAGIVDIFKGRAGIARFDENDDYIITQGTDWFPTGNMSISVWIYAESWGEQDKGRILSSHEGQRLYLTGINNEIRFSSNDGINKSTSDDDIDIIKKWRHIVVNRVNEEIRFYIDGERSYGEIYGGVPISGDLVYIGSDPSQQAVFHGYIDDLMIANRSLNHTEIRELSEWDGNIINCNGMDYVVDNLSLACCSDSDCGGDICNTITHQCIDMSPGSITCNGQSFAVDHMGLACCSPIDCQGYLCDESSHQCNMSHNPCEGLGSLNGCFGYQTTVMVNATSRSNRYWVWDAHYINDNISSKGGISGIKSVNHGEIYGDNYCYLTGMLEGEYKYDEGRVFRFYGDRFCITPPDNTFCIGSNPGYSYVDKNNMGFSERISGSYINTYEICDGCLEDAHCPGTGNPCTKNVCINNKCVERNRLEGGDPIDGCEFNTRNLTECQILGIPNNLYKLGYDFKVDKVVNGKGCLVVTAPGITIDCGNSPMINPSYDSVGIYTDQEDTTIRNCRISLNETDGIGISLEKTAFNAHVHDNIVTDNYIGIDIRMVNGIDPTNMIIENNIANNNDFSGIYQGYSTSDWHWTSDPAYTNVIIRGNTANNNGYSGIYVHASGNTVSGNKAKHGKYGILVGGKDCIVTGNTVEDNSMSGIYIRGSFAAVGDVNADTWTGHEITRNKACYNAYDTRYISADIRLADSGQAAVFDDNQCDTRLSTPGGCDWDCSEFVSSDLPIIIINSMGQGIPDEPKIPANLKIIYDYSGGRNFMTDPGNDYDSYIGVEERGQSSQWSWWLKRSYSTETWNYIGSGDPLDPANYVDKQVSLMQFPEEEDWLIKGDWVDKTLMRNVLTYRLSNQIGRYAARTKLVEVFLANTIEEGWTAYNDFGGTSTGHVTNFGNGESGELVKHPDGSGTGATISLVGGSTILKSPDYGAHPYQGTDAYDEFYGALVLAGISYTEDESDYSIVIEGLSNTKTYTMVLYGDRNAYENRYCNYTITGAYKFVNTGSEGTVTHTKYSDSDTTEFLCGNNDANGHVVKWSNILPETNNITIEISGNADSKRYVNGIKIIEQPTEDLEYRGVYTFMEKMKRDSDRIDIDKLEPHENSGDDLTGGYILKMDKVDEGDLTFRTDSRTLAYGEYAGTYYMGTPFIHYYPKPEDITPEQTAYIQNLMQEFEDVLDSPDYNDPVIGYKKYIDVDAFIDNLLLVEFTKNMDALRTSTYLYKDRLGKIAMGPVWDYDFALANFWGWGSTNPANWQHRSTVTHQDRPVPFWWKRLMEDPEFKQRFVDRWFELRQYELDLDANVFPMIDEIAERIDEAKDRNFDKYKILGVGCTTQDGFYVGMLYCECGSNPPQCPETYEGEVQYIKDYLTARVEWIDNNIRKITTTDFTVVVLPDTQYYSKSYPDIFTEQAQWIVDNKDALNIKFVVHVGDIVHNGSSFLTQWDNANTSLSVLDGVVPYLTVPGNHDYDGECGTSKDSSTYNDYFPNTRYDGYGWYGGNYPSNKNDNNYGFFSIGSEEFLVMGLDFCPSDDTLAWAEGVINSHPGKKVIIFTHAYLETDGTRIIPSYDWSCSTYGCCSGGSCNEGEDMWNELIKNHPNIILVLSGHMGPPSGGSRRTDYVNGNPIHQLFQNWQYSAHGGDGWLRIYKFVPGDRVYVKTYSPYLNQYSTTPENQFELEYSV